MGAVAPRGGGRRALILQERRARRRVILIRVGGGTVKAEVGGVVDEQRYERASDTTGNRRFAGRKMLCREFFIGHPAKDFFAEG